MDVTACPVILEEGEQPEFYNSHLLNDKARDTQGTLHTGNLILGPGGG